MESKIKNSVSVQAIVKAPLAEVWKKWTNPEDIINWNFASDDWQCPWAKNDLRVGGKFLSRMEAKDGSVGFDFSGVYDKVEMDKLIEYSMSDGRKVTITFFENEKGVEVVETFETENSNSVEMQRGGWQAILNNFKKYAEKQ